MKNEYKVMGGLMLIIVFYMFMRWNYIVPLLTMVGIVLGVVSGIVLWEVFLKYILKDTAKLSIEASNIIFDVKRTEINPGNGNNGKIAINELLSLHADTNERKFIKNYAETKSAFDGIAITISAYLFAIFTLLIALSTNVLQSLQMHLDIMPLIVAAISLMVMTIISRVGHMLNRNEAIIMSIEDEWNDQDESHMDSNAKNTGEDDATMNMEPKKTIFSLMSGALLVIIIFWMIINYFPSIDVVNNPLTISDVINIMLTFTLVAVTTIYAWLTHKIVKQGTAKNRIAFIERILEKLYMPMIDFLSFLDANKLDFGDGRYQVNPKHLEIGIKMVDKFVPFQYLAKDDVQRLFPDINYILHNGVIDGHKWQFAIDSLNDKINRDIEAYTKELKSLLKEE